MRTLFRAKTFASVWHWLDRLGVPLRDRRDVAQDVFLAALEGLPRYDPTRSRPLRWLNWVAVHVASHYHDRARRRAVVFEDLDDVICERPGPDEQIGAEQERRYLANALQLIDPEQRAVLVAHDVDARSMAEIAEELGIPLRAAYRWRSRAIAALVEAARGRKDPPRGTGPIPGRQRR